MCLSISGLIKGSIYLTHHTNRKLPQLFTDRIAIYEDVEFILLIHQRLVAKYSVKVALGLISKMTYTHTLKPMTCDFFWTYTEIQILDYFTKNSVKQMNSLLSDW